MWDLYLTSIEIELGNIYRYVKESEVYFENEQNKLCTKRNDEWFWEIHGNDEMWVLCEVFPNLLRRSIFITLYSYLEFKLNELCKILEIRNNQKLKLIDINGKGIKRALIYLEKVLGISFNNNNLDKIRIYNEIRNFLVHNNGEFNITDQNKIHQFNKMNIISEDGKIILCENFCSEVVDTIQSFLRKLVNEVCEKYPIIM